MAVLTEAELLQIRRQLHQIPELALKEYQTHAYLLDVIKQMKQDYLEIREPAELPTALLVLVMLLSLPGIGGSRRIGRAYLVARQERHAHHLRQGRDA